MASSLIFVGHPSGNNYLSNTTRYSTISARLRGDHLSEVKAQIPIRQAGTASEYKTYVPSNTISVNTVITLRKNSADTTMTVTYTSLQTGAKEDTTNSASIANTDELDHAIVVASGGTKIFISVISFEFNTTANASTCLFAVGGGFFSTSTASTTTYWGSAGVIDDGSTTEIPTKLLESYTTSNLYSYVESNTRSTTTTIRVRKNSANGNQTVAYTAGQTGVKEDTTNTDSYVSGDDSSISYTTGTGIGTITLDVISVQHVSEYVRAFEMISANSGQAFTSTDYNMFIGAMTTNTTEANAQIRTSFDFKMTNLRAYVAANTATGVSTIDARVNSATVMTCSYAVAETGYKSDTTLVTIVDGDYFTCRFVRGTSGTLTVRYIAIQGYTSTGWWQHTVTAFDA